MMTTVTTSGRIFRVNRQEFPKQEKPPLKNGP
jgi:hypothetical protein